uniref:Uncharacterized protein n=1 Tax=Arundo donax TaxID=35708 RepID=A0A0A9G530_ARUDO
MYFTSFFNGCTCNELTYLITHQCQNCELSNFQV